MRERNPQEVLSREDFIKPMSATLALKFNTDVDDGEIVLSMAAKVIDAHYDFSLSRKQLEDKTAKACLQMKKEMFNGLLVEFNRWFLEEQLKN